MWTISLVCLFPSLAHLSPCAFVFQKYLVLQTHVSSVIGTYLESSTSCLSSSLVHLSNRKNTCVYSYLFTVSRFSTHTNQNYWIRLSPNIILCIHVLRLHIPKMLIHFRPQHKDVNLNQSSNIQT